jgi:murein L,D-transpeptidase YafK
MTRTRIFLALLLCLPFSAPDSSAAGAMPAGNGAGNTRPAIIATVGANDAETRLIDIYKDIGGFRIAEAREKADALVSVYPHFRLGQLVRGDLLMMAAHPVNTFGAAPGAPAGKMQDLRAEATVRIQSLQKRPDPTLIPKAVLQVGNDQKTVLVVDTRHSRLYVYVNDNGVLKLHTDYYISQGKLGVNKIREGDQKTPIGVYAVSGRIPGQKLPDFYGIGALPLNYPNEWDRRNGRGGSGIWLHGTPSDNYSRPPLSSDGCVVLTNPDLQALYNTTESGKTTVLISDGVEFIDKAAWNKENKAFTQLIQEWTRDAESDDRSKLLANYSTHFRSGLGENLTTWFTRQQKGLSNTHGLTVKLSDVSLFLYPGEDALMVGTFTQETSIGKSKSITRKRQYWVKEDTGWKIIYEGIV